MHLVGPWLTTTGKKKGKKKWASAEHKRRAELAKDQREVLYREYKVIPQKRKIRSAAKIIETKTMNTRYQDHLNTTQVSSVPPTWAICTKPVVHQYSGERQLLGVATMHKSNMVPIFADNKEVAVDIARMRRG